MGSRRVPATGGWFQALFGAKESNYAAVKEMFSFDAEKNAIVAPNQEEFDVGVFSRPSVKDLRDRVAKTPRRQACPSGHRRRNMTVKHISTADVMELHAKPEARGALFQAASQMNCLEMVSANVSPEDGIRNYLYDRTQGPACALVSPAATLYRNYFVPVTLPDGTIHEGQTTEHQLNNLEDFEKLIGNAEHRYFDVINGYVMSNKSRLEKLKTKLDADPQLCEQLQETIRIGLHADVPVVFGGRDASNFVMPEAPQRVTQAYCSALSIAYNYGIPMSTWEPFESIVLNGMYEATLLAAILRAQENPEDANTNVFLTLIGGGAYGNDLHSIIRAIAKAIASHRDFHMTVYLVHYQRVDTHVQELLDRELEKEYLRLYRDVMDL